MRVICTATGGCRSPLTLPQDGSCPDKRCPYHTRISEPIEVEDSPGNLQGWAESLIEAGKIGLRYHQAFEAMAAAFEELAGEHRETLRDLADMDLLYDTLWREFNSLQAVPPSPGPDYSLVRQHWARRRRSRTSPEARSEATPTEDTAEAVSESPASLQGQGETSHDRWTCHCGLEWKWDWFEACPECGAYRPDIQARIWAQPEGLAVCRWEVGRWGI